MPSRQIAYIRHATDTMMAGKVAIICGYGDVDNGSAAALHGADARVKVTEIDPICALQATMDGFEVTTLEEVVDTADIFITTTGNKDVMCIDHMRAMKDMAIVGYISLLDNEIQISNLKNHKWTNIKGQVDMIEMPNGHRLILLVALKYRTIDERPFTTKELPKFKKYFDFRHVNYLGLIKLLSVHINYKDIKNILTRIDKYLSYTPFKYWCWQISGIAEQNN